MSSETLKEFVANFKDWNPNIIKKSKKAWDKHTLFMKGDAGERTPLVTGQLEGSGAVKKARVSKNGIVSRIVFTAPYAKRIHDDPNIKLRDEGPTKPRKGEKKFLQNAVDDGQNDLFAEIGDIIVKEFVKL